MLTYIKNVLFYKKRRMIKKNITRWTTLLFQFLMKKGYSSIYHTIHITALIVFVSEMVVLLFFISDLNGRFPIVSAIFTAFVALTHLGRYLQIGRLLKGDQKTCNLILEKGTGTVSEYKSFQYLRRLLLITTLYLFLLIISFSADGKIWLIFPIPIAGITVDIAWLLLISHYVTYINTLFMELLAQCILGQADE